MTQSSEPTPVMKQYLEAKAAAKDALLLFRMGDFYELFYDDAYKAGDALGLTVTSRDRNKGPEATPMAGFPHHQLDLYLARLINAGYKVAVCEQTEDPKKTKNIVRREVVRIVTPGTVTDDAILDPKTSNYLAGIALPPKFRTAAGANDLPLTASGSTDRTAAGPHAVHPDETIGLAWVELSTGQFFAAVLPFKELSDQLARIEPSEILLPESASALFSVRPEGTMFTERPDWTFQIKTAGETLLRQLKVSTLEGFGFDPQNDHPAICAAGAVIDYLRETQKQSLEHIDSMVKYRSGGCLEIDRASQKSLEIFHTAVGRRREGSLLSVMDRCVTPMGSRLLCEWVVYPLTDIERIERRLDAVEELIRQSALREEIRRRLRGVFDLARIMTRVLQDRATPRELIAVGKTLRELPFFKESLAKCSGEPLRSLCDTLFPLEELTGELAAALGDNAPLNFRDGGFIETGYCAELDECRQLQRGGKQWLAAYQLQESEKTGIPNLKVGFNSVFGYYIEITRAHSDKAPAHYIRKQTLKNAERYITEELKVHEEKVLNAEENAKRIEFELFDALRKKVALVRAEIQKSAETLARLDVFAALAEIAAARSYCRPKLTDDSTLHIKDGRHPVLELAQTAGSFVPNDADCAPDRSMIHLITGPNMAGKSTFIRQVALLVIMAQTGSFVPAAEATIGVADRIFARVGASDELTRGLSTFMVEMIETARILNGATAKSLVVLDEIGRGTSTYDGISLAWAIAESLHEQISCRTFFATHYHELTDLAETCSGIDNLNVAVREWEDDIAFLHKIVPGPADKSYGIHVARLAGVPNSVIRRAKKILDELELSHIDLARETVGEALKSVAATAFLDDENNSEPVSTDSHGRLQRRTASGAIQFSLFGPDDHPIVEELRSTDINALSPLEALALLARWKQSLETLERKNRRR